MATNNNAPDCAGRNGAHTLVDGAGDFELWLAPDGTFSVYSPIAIVATTRNKSRAYECMRAAIAKAEGR